MTSPEGILLVHKAARETSFSVVAKLRKVLGVQKIGHVGTLDPFATGLLVLLIGKKYTKKAPLFSSDEKEYKGVVHLGINTNTYDSEGVQTVISERIPSLEEIKEVLVDFQGTIEQLPPIFSAKKIGGKRMYDLARKGKPVLVQPISVTVSTTLIDYTYPYLTLEVTCSKGTYIRSIAYDIGKKLGVGGYLEQLLRVRSGRFFLDKAVRSEDILHMDKEAFFEHLLQ